MRFVANKKWILEIVSALFILLFMYTALSKLATRALFVNALGNSPLIGKYNVFFSWFIPVIEIAVVMLLFFPKTKMKGIYASLALMIAFTAYLSYMVLFAPHLPCTCGGVIQQMTWREHIVFNAAFIVLAIIAIISQRYSSSPGRTSSVRMAGV